MQTFSKISLDVWWNKNYCSHPLKTHYLPCWKSSRRSPAMPKGRISMCHGQHGVNTLQMLTFHGGPLRVLSQEVSLCSSSAWFTFEEFRVCVSTTRHCTHQNSAFVSPQKSQNAIDTQQFISICSRLPWDPTMTRAGSTV